MRGGRGCWGAGVGRRGSVYAQGFCWQGGPMMGEGGLRAEGVRSEG